MNRLEDTIVVLDEEDDYEFKSLELDIKQFFRKIELFSTKDMSLESSLNSYHSFMENPLMKSRRK